MRSRAFLPGQRNFAGHVKPFKRKDKGGVFKLTPQIEEIASLLKCKAKIEHHGGMYCKIARKQFIYAHVFYAKAYLYQQRKAARA
jgi:hypothetical protein